ncbi:hypothetical protein [Alterinioella nitratireducens]|uniref:hypothetical protein n=1 Tax=Alterinioella nitratireducens TaxID=2735915 RepID=UPI001552AEE9|nr:hypothetical protein [Alterinioella nitratireducens]NPD21299.1 hypothetical protein [Alterinioella nitratireducens]
MLKLLVPGDNRLRRIDVTLAFGPIRKMTEALYCRIMAARRSHRSSSSLTFETSLGIKKAPVKDDGGFQ